MNGNRMYDAYETASVRSHNTSRSNSTYRSAGDISGNYKDCFNVSIGIQYKLWIQKFPSK